MAKCPKCGRKLHLYNVSQFCPDCKTNLRFYNFEENFFKEAKIAELSQAGIHVKVRRLKAAFIGSPLAIARLIVMLLPVVGLLIPAGSVALSLPFRSADFVISGLGIYTIFTGDEFNYIMSMLGSEFTGDDFSGLFIALIAYASIALFAVFVLLTSILCFISYKNMQKITAVFAGLGIIDCIVAAVIIGKFVKGTTFSAIISASNGFGCYAAAILFAVVLAVNLILSIKGIPVEYAEGMLERSEIWKKVKAGEVNVDDLPQPVVETEATRAIEAEIAKAEKELEEEQSGEAAKAAPAAEKAESEEC